MRPLLLFLLAVFLTAPAFAAGRDPLNKLEQDELRETAQDGNKRIQLFLKFTRARMLAIQQVHSDPNIPDRVQQMRELIEDFNTLTDELDDNLDMYTRQKQDFRKALKLAIEAYSEWQVKLRGLKETLKPEELSKLRFVLDTAIENVNAGADITREMLAEQEEARRKKKKPLEDEPEKPKTTER